MSGNPWTGLALACLIITTSGWLGIPAMLGAHPFWAMNVVWLGMPIGALLGIVAGRGLRPAYHTAFALAGIVVAGYVAYSGKTAFANSYAEDVFAGKMWYFGWIALTAMGVLLVHGLVRIASWRKET